MLNSEKMNTYDKHMFNQPNNRCLIYHGSLDVYFSFKNISKQEKIPRWIDSSPFFKESVYYTDNNEIFAVN